MIFLSLKYSAPKKSCFGALISNLTSMLLFHQNNAAQDVNMKIPHNAKKKSFDYIIICVFREMKYFCGFRYSKKRCSWQGQNGFILFVD